MKTQNLSELNKMNLPLKAKLIELMPTAGDYPTAIAGVNIFRREQTNQLENCFYQPLVSVVLQGYKKSEIGTEEFRYGENDCFIAGVDMPSFSYITDASPEIPFISISLNLDKYLITRLVADIQPPADYNSTTYKGMAVTKTDPAVMEAFWRLTKLLDKKEEIVFMAPMLIKEIHYRLLTGPLGGHLRSLNTLGTQSNQIAQAITWLRNNYKESLFVDDLAKSVNMASSTFHRHFREVTSLSPLQFQKRLRLYEAQRLMLINNNDAVRAALAVGYESPTQFSREYKRLFGEPPHRDMKKINKR